MKKFLSLSLVLLSLSLMAYAESAYLNIKDPQVMEKGHVKLNTMWDFYYGKFIPYGQQPDEQPLKVFVPHKWNDYPIADKYPELKEGKGSGTYRLIINNLKPNAKYSFLTYKAATSAFKVFANDKLIFTSGTPDEDYTKTKMQQYMNYATFETNETGSVTLTFFVSNYEYRKGGIIADIKLQETDALRTTFIRKLIVFEIISGFLLTIIIYSILLYSLNKESYHFYLALFVLTILSRIMFSSYPIIKNIFPDIPYSIMLRIEYIALFLAPGVFTLYINSLNKNIFKPVPAFILTIPAFIFLILNFTLPIIVLNRIIPLMQIWLGISIAINLTFLFINLFRQKDMVTYTTMFTLIIIGLGSLSLILLNNNVDLFHGHHFLSESFVLYSMCQVIFIAWLQNKNMMKVVDLNVYLEDVNKAYYRFVPKEFLNFLSKKDITELNAGEMRSVKMAILSADIRNFTTISEQYSEMQVFEMLNSYLKKIAPIIRKNNGIIEKYLGDGLIAIFPESAESALYCAIEMQEQMVQLRKEFIQKNLPELKIGVGVHYGDIIIGTGGNNDRISEISLSKNIDITVNTEAATKVYHRPIIVTKTALQTAAKEASKDNRTFNFKGSKIKTEDNSELYYIYNKETGNIL